MCATQVRIMATNKMRNYITYALTLLQEKGHTSVVLKAMGRAINKTVTIGERGGGSTLGRTSLFGELDKSTLGVVPMIKAGSAIRLASRERAFGQQVS